MNGIPQIATYPSYVAHVGTEYRGSKMTKSVRHRSGALQAILATAAIAISVTACASDDTGTLRDPEVVAKLHDLGLGVSTYAGVPSPTATVSAATYEVTDVGIVNEEPDLSNVASDTVDLMGK